MRNDHILITTATIILFIVGGCEKGGKAPGDTHREENEHHTMESVETDDNHDEHEDHAERGGHEEHEHHDDHGMEVSLTPEAIRMAGITISKAENGRIKRALDVSGEIGFNEDRLVHITPRFPGIAREVNFRIGESVKEGDVVAVVESNESLTKYSLRAPISGRIIEKHIAPGEHVSNEESILLLADLSNVWVNLAVYPQDAPKIRKGLHALISAVGSNQSTEGTIRYITPVIDPQTRTLTARVVLSNMNNKWRPGTFVTAHISTDESDEGLVVDKSAIQVLGEKNVIFIPDEPGSFKPVEVSVGENDEQKIRILSGLADGDEYVNSGAFELKAKIVTSALGEHAGHGH